MIKKILVTGVTSGIGRALAFELAEKGYELVLLGRSVEKLKAVKQELKEKYECYCKYYTVDLNSPCEIKAFLNQKIPIDAFIHCAGLGKLGDFNTLSIEQEEEIYQVNVHASVLLLKLVAQYFIAKGQGTIIAVCSTAAFYPHPFMNTYAASKAFLYHYCLGLSQEVKHYNKRINVIAVSPGPTKTDFFNDQMTLKLASGAIGERFEMTAKQVAKSIVKTLHSNRVALIIGWRNKCFTKLIQWIPLRLRIKIIGRYLAKGV